VREHPVCENVLLRSLKNIFFSGLNFIFSQYITNLTYPNMPNIWQKMDNVDAYQNKANHTTSRASLRDTWH